MRFLHLTLLLALGLALSSLGVEVNAQSAALRLNRNPTNGRDLDGPGVPLTPAALRRQRVIGRFRTAPRPVRSSGTKPRPESETADNQTPNPAPGSTPAPAPANAFTRVPFENSQSSLSVSQINSLPKRAQREYKLAHAESEFALLKVNRDTRELDKVVQKIKQRGGDPSKEEYVRMLTEVANESQKEFAAAQQKLAEADKKWQQHMDNEAAKLAQRNAGLPESESGWFGSKLKAIKETITKPFTKSEEAELDDANEFEQTTSEYTKEKRLRRASRVNVVVDIAA
jgi:hypothetical protein